MYQVKTRNWHCKKWIFHLLNISKVFGTVRGDSYEDGDGKFFLQTNNPIKAWVVWTWFMFLRRWSGGWTYIVRPQSWQDFEEHIFEYRAIY